MTSPELWKQAISILGSEQLAYEWWIGPNLMLDGKAPSVLANTATGRERIRVYLTQMEYGVYV